MRKQALGSGIGLSEMPGARHKKKKKRTSSASRMRIRDECAMQDFVAQVKWMAPCQGH